MGPQSFECGNAAARSPAPWSPWRFNGAALVRVRKWQYRYRSRYREKMLQWGRTRSSAEIDGVQRPELEQVGRFNGAALVRVRKSAFRARRPGAPRSASMGPHSFECGNCQRLPEGKWSGACFNGAALVRVRKSLEPDRSILQKAKALQWGRTRSSAEMRAGRCARSRCAFCFNGAALVRVWKSGIGYAGPR